MTWAVPEHSRSKVNAAGQTLVDENSSSADQERALEIINNWRSAHSYPLHTFQVWLGGKVKTVDQHGLVARRIKRLPSIEAKLRRFNDMQLARMQDIGGCRAIVKDVATVNKMVSLYKKSSLKHKLVKENDYISKPQATGYRGVHLIYRYYSDKKETYNDLQIEIQLRSKLQHAWATAVETFGTFTKQALKSSQGDGEWLRFFALMGTAIALREKSTPIPGTPIEKKLLIKELKAHADKLKVKNLLETYGNALKTLEEPSAKNADYFLLKLDPEANQVTVFGYKKKELDVAAKRYLDVERSIQGQPGAEAVLVAVESLASLRRAYPNYFLDTKVFIEALRQALD